MTPAGAGGECSGETGDEVGYDRRFILIDVAASDRERRAVAAGKVALAVTASPVP